MGQWLALGSRPMEGDRNVVRRDSGDEGYGSGAVLHGDKIRFGRRGGCWRESEEDSYSLRKQADVEA